MYTSIPTGELPSILEKWCDSHSISSAIKQELLSITKLIIGQNYYKFRDRVYIKREGPAMGAPSSSILSEQFLQYLENTDIYETLQAENK
jgi:hypothetical protein